MTLALVWWAALVAALGLAAWALYAVAGPQAWLAAAGCAATALSATLALRGGAGRPAFVLLYAGFALGLASLVLGVLRRGTRPLPAFLAGAWAVALPLALPYLP